MSRRGVESKPAWSAAPASLRRAVADVLGSPVARAERVYGGYAPTPTYRLLLADGRRAFFKGVSPESNDVTRRGLDNEARVYRELRHVIEPWAPAFLGEVEADGWRGLLLEDLGPKSAPPWTPGLCRDVSRAYAAFHASTRGADMPDWLPRPDGLGIGRQWLWSHDEARLRSLAALAATPGGATTRSSDQTTRPRGRLPGAEDDAPSPGRDARDEDDAPSRGREARHGDATPSRGSDARADEALAWLAAAAPALREASERADALERPWCFLHFDTRSDNLRWRDGRLRLFDWPWVGVGPPEWDLAAFAQSVTVEGGPAPEQVVAWYGQADEDLLHCCVADVAGFFAARCWMPEIPGLPRLRAFQRAQMKVTLAWAARALDLPEPEWLETVPS